MDRRQACLSALLVASLLVAPAAAVEFDGRRSKDAAPEAVQPPPAGKPAELDQRRWVVVRVSGRPDRSRAAALGLDIEEAEGSTVSGVATVAAIERLRGAGFTIERQDDLRRLLKGFPGRDEAYHDYGEVQAALAAIAAANPEVASLVELGTSVRGRKLTAIRFNSSEKGEAPSKKPGAVFIGNHHAREHLSTEVPLLAAKWIAENKAKPEVARLLKSRDVYFLPLLNPDGAEYDVEHGDYRWQRKNLRPNEDGTFGVDLNRNYDSHWGESGTSTYPSDDTYGGPGPFSELESRAVKSFLEGRRNIRTMISYHSYHELILYPWSYTDEPMPDGPALKAFKAMAEKMAGWTGYRAAQSSELYPSSGDTCDWAWAALGVFCFTYELTPRAGSGGGFYPGAGVIAPTVAKNVPAILYLIDAAGDPLGSVLGPDWSGQPPLERPDGFLQTR